MSNLLEKHSEILMYLPDVYTASQRSKVTRKKMGSIILGHIQGKVWQILSDGCNGVGSGLDHVFEQDGVTLSNVLHAEENAINKLQRLLDFKAIDLSVYSKIVVFVMSSPCAGCAKRIVESGFITDVVYVDSYRDQSTITYLKDNNIQVCQVNSDQVFDNLNSVIKSKGNFILSIIQKQFTDSIIKELTGKGEDPLSDYRTEKTIGTLIALKGLDLVRDTYNMEVSRFSYQRNTSIYDFSSIFKKFGIKVDKDFAAALRYVLLSIAGSLSCVENDLGSLSVNVNNLDAIKLNHLMSVNTDTQLISIVDEVFSVDNLSICLCYKNMAGLLSEQHSNITIFVSRIS